MALIPPDGQPTDNTLPVELLREIFLFGIEVNQMKSGHLAAVCSYWRDVINTMPTLWSTLRLGTWTEREQVDTWVQRAYPKKVVIETERDGQEPSNAPRFAAFQAALAHTGQWNQLTISSFPPEIMAGQLNFQGAKPMKPLQALDVTAGCVHSPSLIHLLDLVPSTDSSLSELRLHPPFATAYFLQPHWLPALQNLTVLIINGRDVDEPFQLLPAFTKLQTFEADHLHLQFYEPDINLPLCSTLQKLHLRASSVQWMSGRVFPCIKECAIILPHHQEAVRGEVELPSCEKFTYDGYPMTTVEHFRLPEMKSMELRSHDSNQTRVPQQLHQVWTSHESISKLTTLHLTLQCSGKAIIERLKDMGPLQELVLSIPHRSWHNFLKALAVAPLGNYCPKWSWDDDDAPQEWTKWTSSQAWRTNVLPCLKYLGMQSSKGFSKSQCLDNSPLLRLVAWTRAQLITPLEHLDVLEGSGTTDDSTVDYISTDYLDKHLGTLGQDCDWMIVRGMVTKSLLIHHHLAPSFKPTFSTTLIRQLQVLRFDSFGGECQILPYLEQIKELDIRRSKIPAHSLDIDLPLFRTLQRLKLDASTFSWMLGRTFKALKEWTVEKPIDTLEDLSKFKGLRVDMPTCTTLRLLESSTTPFPCSSHSNIQILELEAVENRLVLDDAVFRSLHDFLLNCRFLQKLDITIYHHSGLDSLIQFAFYDALEGGVWRYIRSVRVEVWFKLRFENDGSHFLNQMVGHEQDYKKRWKDFKVSKDDDDDVILRACM
jgi:F-box-like